MFWEEFIVCCSCFFGSNSFFKFSISLFSVKVLFPIHFSQVICRQSFSFQMFSYFRLFMKGGVSARGEGSCDSWRLHTRRLDTIPVKKASTETFFIRYLFDRIKPLNVVRVSQSEDPESSFLSVSDYLKQRLGFRLFQLFLRVLVRGGFPLSFPRPASPLMQTQHPH